MKLFKKLFLVIILLIIILVAIGGFIGYSYYQKALEEKSLSDRINEIQKNDNFVKYDNLAKNYINAVIATEDHRFYEHGAIDFISIGRAIYTNIQEKDFKEGGSTITQQVAKNVCFSQKQNFLRKSGEIFAAIDLEKNYSKNEIFEIYVNNAYFGNGYYGIGQASLGYYNKKPSELNLSECAMLAGVPNAPSVYAPTKNPDLAKQRQKHVLRKMVKYGYITQEEADNIQ